MANTITLFKQNAPELLDTVYAEAAKTSVLDMDASLVRDGLNANEIVVPKLSMDGLGDYDRNSGYTDGDVSLTNETVKYNYERGRRLKTDAIDNEETGGVILSNLASEFVRTKVVPEVDAVRFATYAGLASTMSAGVDPALDTGAGILSAIEGVMAAMTDAQVPTESRHLFITATAYNKAKYVATTTSNAILEAFASVQIVPQTRFYTKIALKDGVTSGEETGGYSKAADGANINFLIIEKSAVLQYTKHAKLKVFSPEEDQDGDDYKMLYRIYGLTDAYENKLDGIKGQYTPTAG